MKTYILSLVSILLLGSTNALPHSAEELFHVASPDGLVVRSPEPNDKVKRQQQYCNQNIYGNCVDGYIGNPETCTYYTRCRGRAK